MSVVDRGGLVLALAAGIIAPFVFSRSLVDLLSMTFITAIAAIGLVLLIGLAGQISLANAALYAASSVIAAQTGVIIGLPFPVVLVCCMVGSALIGGVASLPAYRLRGIYLLLSTLSLHFIAVYLFQRYQVANFGYNAVLYPRAELFGTRLRTAHQWYWLAGGVLVLVAWFARNVARSTVGHRWIVVREREDIAGVLGISTANEKLRAFMLSSAFVGLAGALMVYRLGAVDTSSFTLTLAIEQVVVVVVGGMTSVGGVIAAAIALGLATELIDDLLRVLRLDVVVPGWEDWYLRYESAIGEGLYGLLLIVFLIRRPGGLAEVMEAMSRSVRSIGTRRSPSAQASGSTS